MQGMVRKPPSDAAAGVFKTTRCRAVTQIDIMQNKDIFWCLAMLIIRALCLSAGRSRVIKDVRRWSGKTCMFCSRLIWCPHHELQFLMRLKQPVGRSKDGNRSKETSASRGRSRHSLAECFGDKEYRQMPGESCVSMHMEQLPTVPHTEI
jgi:hypothetical protein